MDPTVPTITDLTTVAGAAILVNIIVQLIKRSANLSTAFMDRFGELLAILTGILVSVVATATVGSLHGADAVQSVLTGVFAGLAAIGIYNTVSSQVPAPKV